MCLGYKRPRLGKNRIFMQLPVMQNVIIVQHLPISILADSVKAMGIKIRISKFTANDWLHQ